MARSKNRYLLAVDLYGFGEVAHSLLPLLKESGIRLNVIRDRSGIRYQGPAGETVAIGKSQHVLVDATSPRYEGLEAEAWVRHLEITLLGGTPVVTCNKAPLAIAWRRLEKAARKGGTTLSCSGTVGAGTPVLLFLQRLQRSIGVKRIDATLNATLGYVCSCVAAGASIEAAVLEAQHVGWAEPDPTLDLDGTDASAKAVIIHNLLFPSRPSLSLKASRPRLHLEERRIRSLAQSGRIPQVISKVTPGCITIGIAGLSREEEYPGAVGQVTVHATLRDGSKVTLAGPGAGPHVTAGALLGDLRALSERGKDAPPGVLP